MTEQHLVEQHRTKNVRAAGRAGAAKLYAGLDAEACAYVQALDGGGKRFTDDPDVQAMRQAMPARWRPPDQVERVVVAAETGVSGLLYPPPEGSTPGGGLVVYLHGGGFTTGSACHADPICRAVARGAACHVLSLDYRLAPECPFPAAVHDGMQAVAWAHAAAAARGFDPKRVAVMGQSAGGNLAAVVAQLWRDRPEPPLALQVLMCPLTDLRPDRHASRQRLAQSPVLPAEALAWFEQQYVPRGVDRGDPRVSPLSNSDLRGLAPAHVITAAGDPLYDEGRAYARAMRAAGVRVLFESHPSIHGFVSLFERFKTGRLALANAVASVARECGCP